MSEFDLDIHVTHVASASNEVTPDSYVSIFQSCKQSCGCTEHTNCGTCSPQQCEGTYETDSYCCP